MATGRIRYTQESVNYARLSACIVGPCTKMMRDLLLKHVQPVSLQTLVHQHLKTKLNSEQKKQLYAGSVPDYSNFDLTFLYLLLRTQGICTPNITPPTNRWGIPPKSALEITTGDDIERIRLIKNEICSHIKSPKLKQAEFNIKLSGIKDVAGRFDIMLATNGDFVTEIDDMIKEPLDREAGESYVEQIQHLLKQDYEIMDSLTELSGQIKDIDIRHSKAIKDMNVRLSKAMKDMNVRHIEAIKNMDVRHSKTIKNMDVKFSKKIKAMDLRQSEAIHRASDAIGPSLSMLKISIDKTERDHLIAKTKRNIERYLGKIHIVKISAYDIIIAKLLKDGFAVITGIPGDGKTTLAYCVIHDIMKDKIQGITRKEPLIISKPSQWKKVVRRRENLIIFIDDLFGISNVTNLIEWKEVMDDVEDVCSDKNDPNRNFFIVAIRIDVLNSCSSSTKNHKLFQSLCSLRDDKNFSKKEKLDFLKKCNVGKPFTSEERDRIVERTKYLGFPQCCRLFIEDENLQKRGAEFFLQPYVFLKQQLQDLWDFEEIKFSALALVMLNGGQVHKEDFCTPGNIDKIKNICRKENPTNIWRNCLEAARSLEGTYLSSDADVFTFTHDSIHHAVAMVLWEDSCKEVIQNCSVDFLSNIVTSKMSCHFQTDSVIISEYHFPVLAKRIVREIISTKPLTNKSIANLKIWEDIELCKKVNEEIVQHSERVNLNKEDENSNSLIYYAVGARNVSFVKYLFTHSPSQKQCYKALNLACEVGDLEIFEICRRHMHNAKVELESIFSAVKGGNEEIYKELTRTSFEINSKFKSNKNRQTVTILQEICLLRKLDLLKLSIQNMTNENFKSISTEQELLHYAALGGCVKMLAYLIERGVDVYQSREFRASVLHFACINGNMDSVKYLSKIRGLLKTTDKITALHYVALGTGSVDVAVYLINEGVDIHTKDDDGSTAFHWACMKGNLNLVKFLHKRDSMLIKMLDKDNRTPLHYVAVGTGSVDVAVYLINEGVDIHTKDTYSATAFHLACRKGNLNLVKFLQDRDSMLIKMLSKNNASPLHYVANFTGSVDVADYIINEGVDLYTKDTDGGTAFHWACRQGNLNLVKFLHERDSLLIKMSDKDKDTSLHYVALGTGSVDVADYLINKGVDIHAKGTGGSTAFHLACYQGKLNLVKFLHESDSMFIKMTNEHNRTPLHYVAAGTGSVDVAVYLINEGVDIHKKDTDGSTALHEACHNGNLNFLKFLNERDSMLIKMLNHYNRTPLHCVAEGNGSVDVAVYIINEGVDIHTKDIDGGTAFHLACKEGNLSLVKFLREKDSMLIKMSDHYNRTSLHYEAGGTGSVDVAIYLINEGVNIHTEDIDGGTAFHLACKEGNLSLVKFLNHRDSVLIKMLDYHKRTPLHYVAEGTGSEDVAVYLINEVIDIRAKDADGGTAFHLACKQGNLSFLKFLHERDSMLSKMSDHYNRTSLHYVALGTGSVDVAVYLINVGVDVHKKNTDGDTAFQSACKEGNLSLVKFLNERDSMLIEMSGHCNRTPLHYVAIGTGSVDVAVYLINEGVDIHTKDTSGGTAFHYACFQGNLNLVKFLHERDSLLIKMSDCFNRTSLDYVAGGTGSVDVAVYLINEGVNMHTNATTVLPEITETLFFGL